MSNFISSLFGNVTSGQTSSNTAGLSHKLIIPALLATSVGLYWQYNSYKSSKNEEFEQEFEQLKHSEIKRIQKMIGKLPLVIKDLNVFTGPEIQAITRRNTIKNKLVGRLKQLWSIENSNKSDRIDSSINSNTINEEVKETLKSEEKRDENIIKTQAIENTSDFNFGISSIYSTGSVVTVCSESDQRDENLACILKKSIYSAKSVKRVSFAI